MEIFVVIAAAFMAGLIVGPLILILWTEHQRDSDKQHAQTEQLSGSWSALRDKYNN